MMSAGWWALAWVLLAAAAAPGCLARASLPLVEPSTLASLVRAAPLVFCGRVARVLLPSRREVLSLQMDGRARVVTAGGRPVPDEAIAAVLLVSVRTMVKGTLPGQRPPQEPVDYLFPRKTVEVLLRGGGSPVEARTLRVLHTAIFLARPDGSRLRLFASPLPMALRYLDVVRAAAKASSYLNVYDGTECLI
ncbi:uncharacterized protein LOC126158378 [Schistocerca cancellata]|uniref:uncharacterized protein LOC126158378 n=1 Tax=Schistocerca cancellata TaxID=274614 RepID=UPI0021187DEC|nr:uncharacterized protein LOC126158378 [Schistocerca cancellata]